MDKITMNDVRAWVHEHFYEVPAHVLLDKYGNFNEFEDADFYICDAVMNSVDVYDSLMSRRFTSVYVEKMPIGLDIHEMADMGFTIISKEGTPTMFFLGADQEAYEEINFAVLYKYTHE